MAETYDITYDGAPVGSAQTQKQGLYYHISCRCRLPEEGLYRIHAINGGAREDLGICVPIGNAFGMDKKLPAKRLGEGDLIFELLPKDWKPQPVMPSPQPAVIEPEPVEPEPEPDPLEEEIEQEELFVPVAEDEPFEYLDKLEDAHMEIRDGQTEIVIPNVPDDFKD